MLIARVPQLREAKRKRSPREAGSRASQMSFSWRTLRVGIRISERRQNVRVSCERAFRVLHRRRAIKSPRVESRQTEWEGNRALISAAKTSSGSERVGSWKTSSRTSPGDIANSPFAGITDVSSSGSRRLSKVLVKRLSRFIAIHLAKFFRLEPRLGRDDWAQACRLREPHTIDPHSV